MKGRTITTKRKKKVLVGMSGGVDSSVAAALLKEAGSCPELGRRVEVVGAHMKCWDEKAQGCNSSDDEAMARRAAAHLGIPLYVFNFVKEYKKRVFDHFLREIKAGRTPNPDTLCNREIKFGLLYDKALKLGFDYVATGHYARLRPVKSGVKGQVSGVSLLRGKDKDKDQTYFLYQVPGKRLARVLFPLGDYTKSEVRKLAKKLKLPNAERKDSQGICFVGNVKLNDFLKRYIKPKKGDIVDMNGNVLGGHEGVSFYTIGQRKGIKLSGGPYFVVAKDAKKNTVIVSKNEKNLKKKELLATDLHWVTGTAPKLPFEAKAQIRYRQKSFPVTVKKSMVGRVKVVFGKPQKAVTPGQAVVFYKGKEVLGGGVIV